MKKTFVLLVAFVLTFGLLACVERDENEVRLDEAHQALDLPNNIVYSAIVGPFLVPLEVDEDITITWTSTDEVHVAITDLGDGTARVEIVRPAHGAGNVNVTLTATLALEEFSKEKSWNLTIVELEDMSPQVTGNVYHWIPGAVEATVTATLDLQGAALSSLTVTYGEEALQDYLDYEVNGNEFMIFGAFLHGQDLGLGDHTFVLETEFGTADFVVSIVDDPRGTSIPTHIISGINMAPVQAFYPTEVIANAPDLLITEIAVDNGSRDYVEVFNNTLEPYNLKGHRIVLTNLLQQSLFETHGVFEQPFGMAGAVYIYQDYIIPPLSSATIWILSQYPWIVDGFETEGVRLIHEIENAESMIFGDGPNNLTIDQFKQRYSLSEDHLVFPVRPQYLIFNNSSLYTADDGLGQPVMKAAASRWTGFNSSINNRGIQIQKFDEVTLFPIGDDAFAPIDATHYRYDADVLNREEDVYVDGVLNPNLVIPYGSATSKRQAINAFTIRKAYYDAQENFLGYGTGAAGAIDAYNANQGNYMNFYREAVTPLATAIIYPQIDNGVAVRWGSMHSLEYRVPAPGSTVARFIPREVDHGYDILWESDSLKDLKLAAIASYVLETSQNIDIEVPVSPVYPVTYVRYNTAGRTAWYNFFDQEPTS